MKPFSVVAIYVLFWALSLFLVLPFGMRTHEEAGTEKTLGQADSAPAHWRPAKIVLRTTIVAALLFGLFFANYIFGWVGADQLDLFSHTLK